MQFKNRDPEKYQEYKSRIRSMMGTAGICGLLEVLADVAQDFGDGKAFDTPDPFWLSAAAQIEQCKERVEP